MRNIIPATLLTFLLSSCNSTPSTEETENTNSASPAQQGIHSKADLIEGLETLEYSPEEAKRMVEEMEMSKRMTDSLKLWIKDSSLNLGI